jgi:hypothetical protein
VQFTTATTLVARLAMARGERRLDEKLLALSKPKLLIVDELGYQPLEPDAAHLFFQTFSRRYETGGMLITSCEGSSRKKGLAIFGRCGCRIDQEIRGCEFRDAWLGDRFRELLKQIGSAVGQSIPLVCQDWANTKAAYRFFSNERPARRTFWPAISNRHVIRNSVMWRGLSRLTDITLGAAVGAEPVGN